MLKYGTTPRSPEFQVWRPFRNLPRVQTGLSCSNARVRPTLVGILPTQVSLGRMGVHVAKTGYQFQPNWIWVEFRCGIFGFSGPGRSKGTKVEHRRKRLQTRSNRNRLGFACRVCLVKQKLKRLPTPSYARLKTRCCPERTDTEPATP